MIEGRESRTLADLFPTIDAVEPLAKLVPNMRLQNAFRVRRVSVWSDISTLTVNEVLKWRKLRRKYVESLLEELSHAVLNSLSGVQERQKASVTTPLTAKPPTVGRLAPATREQQMIQMREQGATLDAIGTEFGVTRERVRQIIQGAGGPSPSEVKAGRAARAQEREAIRRERVEGMLRPLLLARGALTAKEAADALGLDESELYWPEDLAHLRIWTAGRADQTWTDDEALSAIREAALYEFPLTAKVYAELIRVGQVHGPSPARVHQRFGGWASACKAAGVEHGKALRPSYESRWSDDELLGYARDYFLDVEWPSSAHRFDDWRREKAPDAPSFQTLRNRFGTWSNLKRAALQPVEGTDD